MMLLYNHDYTARGYEDSSEYYPGACGLFEKQPGMPADVPQPPR